MGDVSDTEDPPDLIEVDEQNVSAFAATPKQTSRVPITVITGNSIELEIIPLY